MKKPLSQSKMADGMVLQEEGVYTLKISHFDPQIEAKSFLTSTRCSHEEKIMRRREMVQTATSRYERNDCFPDKDRRVRSSQEVRMEPFEKISKLQILQQLNQEIEVLTPILDGRITELKSLMHRKPCNAGRDGSREHSVHFTQYVLRQAFPSPSVPSVLHSRGKKECPFMRSVKARSLMSRSMEGRPKRPADDIFKSIELNSSSKYASSKRIAVSGDNIITPKHPKNKGTQARQAAKNYNDRRQSLIARRQKAPSPEKREDECRPWETHHLDIMNDDGDLIHL